MCSTRSPEPRGTGDSRYQLSYTRLSPGGKNSSINIPAGDPLNGQFFAEIQNPQLCVVAPGAGLHDRAMVYICYATDTLQSIGATGLRRCNNSSAPASSGCSRNCEKGAARRRPCHSPRPSKSPLESLVGHFTDLVPQSPIMIACFLTLQEMTR